MVGVEGELDGSEVSEMVIERVQSFLLGFMYSLFIRPSSLWNAHLTAPNRAPSHSFFKVSTVFSGKATPFFLNSSKPASRWTKEKFRPKLLGRASRIFLPAGMTSRPMPSPGSRPAIVSA